MTQIQGYLNALVLKHIKLFNQTLRRDFEKSAYEVGLRDLLEEEEKTGAKILDGLSDRIFCTLSEEQKLGMDKSGQTKDDLQHSFIVRWGKVLMERQNVLAREMMETEFGPYDEWKDT